MTEPELVKEHVRYWQTIKDQPSALGTYLLWCKSEGAAKKAARMIWPTLGTELKLIVRVLLDG